MTRFLTVSVLGALPEWNHEAVINLDEIESAETDPFFSGKIIVVMKTGERFPVSQTLGEFKKALGLA